MTTSQLKRSMDRRFDRIDGRFDRIDRRLNRAKRSTDARLHNLDRKKADKSDVQQLRVELAEFREEMARSAAETRRHFDVAIEGVRDDLRIFADAIGLHSERLDRHETRIVTLERRSL